MYDNYDYLSVAFRILKGLIYSLDPSLVNDDFLQPKRPLHQVDRHQLAAARRLMFCNPDKQFNTIMYTMYIHLIQWFSICMSDKNNIY